MANIVNIPIEEYEEIQANWHLFSESERQAAIKYINTVQSQFAGLPGSELPWREWLKKYFSHVTYAEMVERHERLNTWFDDLARGVKPPPQIEIWARGSAKSTTTELGVCRVGAKLKRRFVLYVSEIQDQADSHVQSISTLLEVIGAQPLMNKLGRARGWRRNQLRTAHGFNVAAFGMDNTQRGIKIDEFRPDLIIFDDIDNRHDSLENVARKIEGMTQTIMPTGSSDLAILFIQNLVHSNSIAMQLVDGRAKFLLNRVVPVPVPAIQGLEVETEQHANGVTSYHVIGGTATWPGGQSIATCEAQINEWGYEAFLREAQHEVRQAGELFFSKFEGYDFVSDGVDGRHICSPFDIPTWWEWFAGYDDGRYNPCALVLCAISPVGWLAPGVCTVYAVEELVARQLSPSERADAVEKIFLKYGLNKSDVTIYADPSTWAKHVDSDRIGRAPVEAFFAKGFQIVKANNNRAHGLDNMTEYINQENTFEVFKGLNPELVRQLSTAVHSKTKAEDLDDDADIPPSHMDAVSALRYALHTRITPPERPANQYKSYFQGREIKPLKELPPELQDDANNCYYDQEY